MIMFLFSIPLDILMWLEMQLGKKNMPKMVLNPRTQNLSENMEEKLVKLEAKIREGKTAFQAI